MSDSNVIKFPTKNDGQAVVSLEADVTITVPHIMKTRDWYRLSQDLRDPDAAVAMRLGYAAWRHLMAIVVDARLMLEFKQHVIVQLRIQQFDDGT